MTRELAATKEANAQLELEIRQLKEAAAGDKEALSTLRRGLEATELERGSLASTLACHNETFATKGVEISSLLSSSLGEVGVHVPPFEAARGADPETEFFEWLEAHLHAVCRREELQICITFYC